MNYDLHKYRYQLKQEPISLGALSAIIGGTLAAGGTAASAIASGKMNKRAEKYNRWALAETQKFDSEQAQIARQWQEDYYKQYSSPSAMVKQYKEAGLNPALMYGSGQGTGSVPSGASASSASALPLQQINPFDSFSGLASTIGDMFMLKEQIANMSADTELKKEQAESQKSLQGLQNSQALLNGEVLNATKKQVELINAQIGRIGKENDLTDAQINQLKALVINISKDNELKDYQISINNNYKQLSEKLGLSIPVTEQIVQALTISAGSIIGNIAGGFFGMLKSFSGLFKGGNKGLSLPSQELPGVSASNPIGSHVQL